MEDNSLHLSSISSFQGILAHRLKHDLHFEEDPDFILKEWNY